MGDRSESTIDQGGRAVATCEEAVALLAAHREELRRRGVAELAIFGSLARGEATPESDVDLLVAFDQPVGLFAIVRLERFLQGILGRRVDLVTQPALKPQLRDRVLAEAVRAA